MYTIYCIRCNVGGIVSTEVLSVRIRKELKEEAKKLGIDLRRVIEKALEEEIRRVKKKHLKIIINEGLNQMKISDDEWIRTVKESRSER